MLSRGQIAGRRLLWLLSRPAPPPRAFCAAEDAQVRLLPAEVRASSEALWRKLKAGGVSVTPDFLSEEEEALLAQELEPQLRRHRYQDEHWDGAIHRYRETETSYWSKECHEILQRVRNAAFPPGVPQLTQVHVLDLDKTGYIKPHVDSVKFCGCTIAGLSLLSSSVMRLVSEQNPQDWLDLLLERRSLYILRYAPSWVLGLYTPSPSPSMAVRGDGKCLFLWLTSHGALLHQNAIHRYRETETSYWSKECHEILQRVRNAAFPPGGPQLTQVHVLDLDKTGYIKPHVDSVKFCGCTIAGLSLLSSSVMRLVSEQNPQDWLDLLLERRSLYILRGPARYEFTHEILKDEESSFDGRKVPRERRISVICRDLPFPGEPS